MGKEKQNEIHKRYLSLPEKHRQILGKYFEHQRSLSIDNTKRKDQNLKLIGLGRRILRYLNNSLPISSFPEEDILDILNNE